MARAVLRDREGSSPPATCNRRRCCFAPGSARGGKYVLGGGALLVALLILTCWDKLLVPALVRAAPARLTDLTTRF